MGAWGLGPFDNDTAQDLTCTVYASLVKKFKFLDDSWDRKNYDETLMKWYEGCDPDELRAVTELLILMNDYEIYFLEEDVAYRLSVMLTHLLSDSSYIDSWDSPKEIKSGIKSQIRKLKRIWDKNLK